MLHIKEEAARCLLCEDAPCTKACIKGDPARAIRAIRFDNIKNAGRWIADCSDTDLERTPSYQFRPDRKEATHRRPEMRGLPPLPTRLPDRGNRTLQQIQEKRKIKRNEAHYS